MKSEKELNSLITYLFKRQSSSRHETQWETQLKVSGKGTVKICSVYGQCLGVCGHPQYIHVYGDVMMCYDVFIAICLDISHILG